MLLGVCKSLISELLRKRFNEWIQIQIPFDRDNEKCKTVEHGVGVGVGVGVLEVWGVITIYLFIYILVLIRLLHRTFHLRLNLGYLHLQHLDRWKHLMGTYQLEVVQLIVLRFPSFQHLIEVRFVGLIE